MIPDNFYNGRLKPIRSGVISGYSFQTSIQTSHADRSESRVSKYPYQLFAGRLTNVALDRDQLDYFNSFFIARGGSEQAFRWTDPLDNTATWYKSGMLDEDPDTYTVGGSLEPEGLTINAFFPAKIYRSGSYITKRPLHLIDGVVEIYSNGVQVGSGIPNEDGLIEYSGSTTGLTIQARFDIPVRFGVNEIPNVMKVIRDGDLDEVLYMMADIPLIEEAFPVIYEVLEEAIEVFVYGPFLYDPAAPPIQYSELKTPSLYDVTMLPSMDPADAITPEQFTTLRPPIIYTVL